MTLCCCRSSRLQGRGPISSRSSSSYPSTLGLTPCTGHRESQAPFLSQTWGRTCCVPYVAAIGALYCLASCRICFQAFWSCHSEVFPAKLLRLFGQVDQRLNGEGTGKILGVDTIEFWPIIIVFGLVWALYYSAGKDLDKGGRGSGEDSGLSL